MNYATFGSQLEHEKFSSNVATMSKKILYCLMLILSMGTLHDCQQRKYIPDIFKHPILFHCYRTRLSIIPFCGLFCVQI